MIMKLYLLVGSHGLGKPFWERKLIGENASREDMQWKEFVGGWYYMITRMTSALYTKETLKSWYRDEEKKNKQLWELLSVSDIAYTIFVLENHSEVWKQEWRFHSDNPNSSQIEKEKFREYKKLTLSEMLDKGLSAEDRKHYLKVKPKFTHGQKKISFCDAVKAQGIEFYKQTHRRLTRFLHNARKREMISVLWKDDEEKDDWMNGLTKNKRFRTTQSVDDSLPPLDSPKCVMALVPGDDGYDEMMGQMNDGDSVCSNE